MGKMIKKSIIALDSMIFIYHFENNPAFSHQTYKIFSSIESGKAIGITSIITLMEILTLPKKKKEHYLVKEYSELLNNFPNLKFIDVNFHIADLASSLRAKYAITPPDALQVATAIAENADYFLTQDIRLKKIKEIKIKLLK